MKEVIKREPNEEDLKYLQAISRDDLLTVEDENALIKQVQRSEGDFDVAKDKLMRANQRFVRSVASRYVSEKYPLEQLIVYGNIGLEQAIYKYDETRGFKFISYAFRWIRQSIQQAIDIKAKPEVKLNVMSSRELDILRIYFRYKCEDSSLEEIQAKYDLTRERAIYIRDKALHGLYKSKEKLSTVSAAILGESEGDEIEK